MFKTFQVIHFKLKLVSDQNGLCFIFNYFVKIHFKKANFLCVKKLWPKMTFRSVDTV